MGYVGDDVMKDWILIFYHTQDKLENTHELHQDNCSTPPFGHRWQNDQELPYLESYGSYPTFKYNGENPRDEITDLSADFLNTGNPASDWDEYYYGYVTIAKRLQEETTPITMSLDGTSFVDRTASVTLSVSSTDDLSARNLRLYVGVTMDSVEYDYGEYEDWGRLDHHNNIWAGWIGDATTCGTGCEDGQEITLGQNTPVDRTYSWTLNDAPTGMAWDEKNMVIFAFIQDFDDAKILQGVKLIRRDAGIDKSAPALTFSPANNEVGVAVNSDITITFDEIIRNLDDSSIDDTNVDGLITLKKDNATGDDIPFDASINTGKTLITINPTDDFSPEQSIYVAIGATVEDEADNAIQPINITFSTVDNTSPTASIDPADASTGVVPSSNITVSFNESVRKVDDSTLDGTVVELKKDDANGDAIPFSASVDAAQKVLTIDPTSDLGSSQQVYICVDGVEDYSNNALTKLCATFTTADGNAPTVNFIPSDGSTDLPVDTKITLTFSEAIRNLDDSALDDTNIDGLITLKYDDSNGTDITFDATIDSDKKIVNLAPSANFEYGKTIYTGIGATVEDASGNPVSASFITFSTIDAGNMPIISTVNDTSFFEDRFGTVNVIVTDANGDKITFSTSSDTSAVDATVQESNSTSDTESLAKIMLKPEENWNGESIITVFADDGTIQASSTFKLTVKPMDDPPTIFKITEPMNNAYIKITDQTIDDTLVFRWKPSFDAEGDTITYKYTGTWGLASISVPYVKNSTETKIAYIDIYNSIDQSGLNSWTESTEISGEWAISACSGMYCVPSENGPYSLTISENVLNVFDNADLPNQYALLPNYPNPFNPQTTIDYQIPEAGHVTIDIFDLTGQKIRSLINQNINAGYHSVVWDGNDGSGNPISSGVYLYRILTDEFVNTRKMILMR